MRTAIVLSIVLMALPAWAQTKVKFSCGTFATEAWSTGGASHWTVARGKEKTTETAILKKGPRFACVSGAILVIEFVAASGQSYLDVNFPDGTNIGYGGQHMVRNGRFVLPIQARPRIPAPFRDSFDYHCRLVMPADPIPADVRKDCVP